jgi:hypothetical protein
MESTRGKFRATAEKENIEEASRRGLQDVVMEILKNLLP